MKLSTNWLKDYVPIKISSEILAHKLTMAGNEVKGMEHVAGDTIFELEITPNRPDCLSVIGVAREAAAILNTSLQLPKPKKLKSLKAKCDITLNDKKGCLRYFGAVLKGVRLGPSPEWLTKRLEVVGLRSVNNIVDITNFCLLETGQPLHAFDYDKLIGGKVIVRRARDGEKIATIDGVERKLNPSILVIADEKRAVAIAGVMGGKDTEVTGQTKNILLESAYFDPILIRRACRTLGLSSDSSYRFERGVDIKTVEFGAQRALSLITQEAGGNLTGILDIFLLEGKKLQTKHEIKIDKNQIDTLLGTTVSLARIESILNKLGFAITAKKNILRITPPSFRGDIQRDVDIIEEIARIVGYDNIPVSIPEVKISDIPESKNRIFSELLSFALSACGLNEAIGYATINRKNLEKTNLDSSNVLKIKNPLTAEQEIMRPSLLPGLLSSVLTNLNRGQKDIRLFEMGKVYFPSPSAEKEAFGIVMTGKRYNDWRKLSKEEIDFYDLKGALEGALEAIGIKNLQFRPMEKPFLEKSQAAEILLSDKKIGILGNAAFDVLTQWDIKQKNIFLAEVDLTTLYAHANLKNAYRSIAEFPAIVRDLSLALKNNVSFEEVRNLAYRMGCEFLVSVKFIEQYLGEKIPAGYRGMTLSLVYQSSSRTLREDEVDQFHDKFCQIAVNQFDAIKR